MYFLQKLQMSNEKLRQLQHLHNEEHEVRPPFVPPSKTPYYLPEDAEHGCTGGGSSNNNNHDYDDDDCSMRLHKAHTRTLSRRSIQHGLIPKEAVDGRPPRIRARPLTTNEFATTHSTRLRQLRHLRPLPPSTRRTHPDVVFGHECALNAAGRCKRDSAAVRRQSRDGPRLVTCVVREVKMPKNDCVLKPRGISRNVFGGQYFS